MVIPLLAVVGAVTDPAGASSACANAIRIEATAKDRSGLRKLLRQGSLAELRSERCQDYTTHLVAVDAGWLLTMSSASSARKFERQVDSLKHASTWIESWTQSGFAPTPDESEEPVNAAAPSIAPGARTAAAVVATAEPTAQQPSPISAFVGVGPRANLTSHGFPLLGGTINAGIPGRHSPWFGAELGIATQVDSEAGHYRRLFWVGPLLGVSIPVSNHVHLRPAATVGIVGAVARNANATAHSAALDAGLMADLELDISNQLALSFGLEGRILFEELLGSASGTIAIACTGDDCGEDGGVTSTTVPLPSGPGAFVGALRLGLVYQFGGIP